MKRPLKDPSLLRLSPSGFQCGETFEEGEVGSVTFYATLPPPPPSTPDEASHGCRHRIGKPKERLLFGCRGRSINVLRKSEDVVDDEDLEEANSRVDPNFFDAGYGLAGRTGFQVWAGSRLMLECLLAWRTASGADEDTTSDLDINASQEAEAELEIWQQRIASGAKVVELGSGVGVVGVSLAAVGAEVLLTDLRTLVENATLHNLLLNEDENEDEKEGGGGGVDANANDITNSGARIAPEWLASTPSSDSASPIGRGWANAAPLDWTKPLDEQLSRSQFEGVEFVVASDCVWLIAMLNALFDTVASIFDASPSCTFVMSFQRRDAADGKESSSFTTVERVVEEAERREWEIESVAWRPVGDGGGEDSEKEIFLFRIRAPKK